MELIAGKLERLLFTDDQGTAGETWQLLQIVSLDGTVVGADSSGVALAYPVALSAVPGASAWASPSLQILNAGKYIAVFVSSLGRTINRPLEVLPSSTVPVPSESGGTTGLYATPAQLLSRYDAVELVRLADSTGLVTAELLTAAVNAGDLSGWTEEEQAAAQAAVARLELALRDASRLIDSHLQERFSLTVNPVPERLVLCTCVLARYYLDRQPPEPIVRRFKDETRWLESRPNLGPGVSTPSPQQVGGPKAIKQRNPWCEALEGY